jgi:hypothetical protein
MSDINQIKEIKLTNENMDQEGFSYLNLLEALTIKLNKKVFHASYQIQKLHGGTVGNVFLITGLASSKSIKEEPYRIIFKKQVKWERYGDINSWRREYDLYHSYLQEEFTDDFSWPICFGTKMHEDSFEIWMDYVDGPSGESLTLDMYQKAAAALGRFQGKLYRSQSNAIKQINNLSTKDYVRKFYEHYQSWDEVYDYIRSDECELSEHLCQMMIHLDSRKKEVFEQLDQMPIVFCHRDYWNTNIIYADHQIFAIDWDTAGYGYFGEDMASLIADGTEPSKMIDYFRLCIPAYQSGFSKYANVKVDAFQSIHDLILLMFGYRLIESFKFADNQVKKKLAIDSLQSIYDMQNIIESK